MLGSIAGSILAAWAGSFLSVYCHFRLSTDEMGEW